MCKCNPSVRTPYCGGPGCEWPEGTPKEYPSPTDNKVSTVKDLVLMHSKLVKDMFDLVQAIDAIRGGYRHHSEIMEISTDTKIEWEQSVKSSKSPAVQLLYSELMAKRAEKTRLELGYVYGLSDGDIDNLNHGRGIRIAPYPEALTFTSEESEPRGE